MKEIVEKFDMDNEDNNSIDFQKKRKIKEKNKILGKFTYTFFLLLFILVTYFIYELTIKDNLFPISKKEEDNKNNKEENTLHKQKIEERKLKFIILLNGELDKQYDTSFFKNYDYIICVDGGYNHFSKLNLDIEPNYIIGDLDSIENKNQNISQNKIIFKDNQDELDSEFSIKFILNKYNAENIDRIDFIYATSMNRLDHVFANILLLKKVPNFINSKIITKYQEFFLCKKLCHFNEKMGKTLSIIPLTNIKNLSIKGCKWELENKNYDFGFIGGISNIIEKNEVEISLKEGECLVIITY